MSLTVEALAKAIFEKPKTFIAGATKTSAMDKAMALWPLIERHIAGQQAKPSELNAEYCRGRNNGWEAAEQKYRQPPKPAGAVPLPETFHPDNMGCMDPIVPDDFEPHQLWCSLDSVIRYGDAREDAGRAVAAVSDHIRRQVGKIDKYRLCMSHNGSYFGEPAGLLKSVVTELAHAVDPIYPDPKPEHDPMGGVTVYTATGTHSAPSAPIPQQPAAEGAAQCASAGNPVPRMPGATISGCVDVASQAEGAGGEAVGEMDRTAPPKVWLQIDPDGDSGDRSEPILRQVWGDLTWCYESIGGQEVVYIRQDLAHSTPASDAGGVTVTDEFVERLARQMMRERYPNDSAVSLDHSFQGNAIYRETWIARARRVLAAALTLEVRHGE